jgi:hypothetical protein
LAFLAGGWHGEGSVRGTSRKLVDTSYPTGNWYSLCGEVLTDGRRIGVCVCALIGRELKLSDFYTIVHSNVWLHICMELGVAHGPTTRRSTYYDRCTVHPRTRDGVAVDVFFIGLVHHELVDDTLHPRTRDGVAGGAYPEQYTPLYSEWEPGAVHRLSSFFFFIIVETPATDPLAPLRLPYRALTGFPVY